MLTLPGSGTNRAWTFFRLYKGSAGYCGAYRGDACRGVLRDDHLVFFNSSLPDPEDLQEDRVRSLWPERDGPGSACGPAMRSLLCHSAFPDCNPSGIGPAPKPVCRYVRRAKCAESWNPERRHTSPSREHCLAVKELYCQGKWAVLEGGAAARSDLFRSGTGSGSLVPDCQALPSLQADPNTCTHVPFTGTSGGTSGQRVWTSWFWIIEDNKQNSSRTNWIQSKRIHFSRKTMKVFPE